MPKNKKLEDSSASGSASDSDSGPEKEEKKPPAKKAKTSSSSLRVEDEKEPTWQLDRSRFIKVREFKGKVYVDIREFYEKDGNMLPGKKGISLNASQFQKLKDAIPEVEEVLKEM